MSDEAPNPSTRRERGEAAGHIHADRDETRQLILSAARKHFLHAGYRGTSTRQVADACGITQPALYHHFGGKEDLYVAMLEQELRHFEHGLWEAAHAALTSREALESAADVLLRQTDFEPSLIVHDMRSELSDGMRAHLFAKFTQAFHDPLSHIMERCIADGIVQRPAKGFSLLGLVRYFLHVMAFFVGQGEAPDEPQHSRATVITLFLNGTGIHTAP